MPQTTIDIDTGGTFTDAFVVRDGEPHTFKVLTTPHDLAVCFQEVVERAAEDLGLTVAALLRETVCVRYATTVGTNAVIQRTGPQLGLIVSEGSESQAGAATGQFVDEGMVATVGGDEAALVTATRSLLDRSARGLVVSLSGGDHEAEQSVRTDFEGHYPKNCLDSVPLLLSHEVDDDPDDTRRTSTALFNAYLHPEVARYLYRCEDWLRDAGYQRPLLIVHNDGGCARVAKTIAGKTYNSGPTAGLMGAEVVSRLYDSDSLVTFDVGGTSLDVAFGPDVQQGAVHEQPADVLLGRPAAQRWVRRRARLRVRGALDRLRGGRGPERARDDRGVLLADGDAPVHDQDGVQPARRHRDHRPLVRGDPVALLRDDVLLAALAAGDHQAPPGRRGSDGRGRPLDVVRLRLRRPGCRGGDRGVRDSA